MAGYQINSKMQSRIKKRDPRAICKFTGIVLSLVWCDLYSGNIASLQVRKTKLVLGD